MNTKALACLFIMQIVGCAAGQIELYAPIEFQESEYLARGAFSAATAIMKDELRDAYDTKFASVLDTDDCDKLLVTKVPVSVDFLNECVKTRGPVESQSNVPSSLIAKAPNWWIDPVEVQSEGPFDWSEFSDSYHTGLRVWIDRRARDDGFVVLRIWIWQRQWSID